MAGAATYNLNLIDTPGHIDFSYEVSRALKAVEGCILLVDATQGAQAQTLTTLNMARELGLNPKKFGDLANHKQEPWKLPLPDYIEELYLKLNLNNKLLYY